MDDVSAMPRLRPYLNNVHMLVETAGGNHVRAGYGHGQPALVPVLAMYPSCTQSMTNQYPVNDQTESRLRLSRLRLSRLSPD